MAEDLGQGYQIVAVVGKKLMAERVPDEFFKVEAILAQQIWN